MQEPWTIDPWSFYDFKEAFRRRGAPTVANDSWIAPTWVGDHWRRLQAYALLESYYRNASRNWIHQLDDEDKYNRREYGDPKTVVDQVLASVIGEDQVLYIRDAEGEGRNPDAVAQLDRLNYWIEEESRFLQKMIEAERAAVKLGDTCYIIGGWGGPIPKLHVYDPGFYFPVLDPSSPDEEFPDKIHVAYEYEAKDVNSLGQSLKYVRRITWELYDTQGTEFEMSYNHPWNDEPTTVTCLYTDATWLVDDLKGTVEDFDPAKATYTERDLDLNIDFIPVVHEPNTIADEEHFGSSTLASVMQLFDDIISTDTDLQAASATTGTPPIALQGADAERDEKGNIKSYGPGSVLETGDGQATMIDTSRSLDALLKYDDHLLKRLAVNSKVPESLLGRVKPNEVPSGITLTLSFAPHTAMIKEMRLVREDKYKILFKFVSRFFMQTGDIVEDFGAKLRFGTFLPADKSETSNLVSTLMKGENKSMSLETAIRMLINAGYPIEDAVQEAQRIRADDFASANAMLDATADVDAVRRRLGLGPAPAAPALPTTPPTPTIEP